MKTTIVRLTMFCLSLIVISLVLAFQSYAKVDLESAAAIWLFDEGEGNEAKDFTGNGHDAELNGTKWVDGKFGKALSFDGGSSNGKTKETDAFALQDFTICFFVNPGDQDEAMESSADKSNFDPAQFLLDYTDGKRLLLRSFYVGCAFFQRCFHCVYLNNSERSLEEAFSQDGV